MEVILLKRGRGSAFFVRRGLFVNAGNNIFFWVELHQANHPNEIHILQTIALGRIYYIRNVVLLCYVPPRAVGR